MVGFLFGFVEIPIYKVTYKVKYLPDLLRPDNYNTERVILFVENNQGSSYASQNFILKDSMTRAVVENKRDIHELIGDPNFQNLKTAFNHFITKRYDMQEIVVTEKVGIDRYRYHQKNNLVWITYPDTLTIKNYLCYKAQTDYGGRKYTAWYCPEIPISDGPYKFWGLPGLIMQIADSEKNYSFEIESISKYDGSPTEMYNLDKNIFEVSFEKFLTIQKEIKQDPLKPFKDRNLRIIKEGQDVTNMKRNLPKLNSIEKD